MPNPIENEISAITSTLVGQVRALRELNGELVDALQKALPLVAGCSYGHGDTDGTLTAMHDALSRSASAERLEA